MKVLLSSLKFSPAHLSHILAYAELFENLGYEPILLLDKDYKKILKKKDTKFEVNWFDDNKVLDSKLLSVDLVMLFNPALENQKVAMHFKKTNKKVFYLFHEPWEGLLGYLGEGLKQTLKATVAHYYSTKVLRLSDSVIVPSNYALKLYKKNDLKYNHNVFMIPLLFCDDSTGKTNISEKKYFSYIGHAVKGHAFDLFIETIKYLDTNIERTDYSFEIATRTDLTNLIRRDKKIQKMICEETLIITHGKPLTNEEINRAYLRSFCIWNVYRRSTQSGVLPKAFMFSTPVLASKIGSFVEFVKSSYNGELITNLNDFTEIISKVKKIRNKLGNYSFNARNSFLKTFYYRANIDKMKLILESAK